MSLRKKKLCLIWNKGGKMRYYLGQWLFSTIVARSTPVNWFLGHKTMCYMEQRRKNVLAEWFFNTVALDRHINWILEKKQCFIWNKGGKMRYYLGQWLFSTIAARSTPVNWFLGHKTMCYMEQRRKNVLAQWFFNTVALDRHINWILEKKQCFIWNKGGKMRYYLGQWLFSTIAARSTPVNWFLGHKTMCYMEQRRKNVLAQWFFNTVALDRHINWILEKKNNVLYGTKGEKCASAMVFYYRRTRSTHTNKVLRLKKTTSYMEQRRKNVLAQWFFITGALDRVIQTEL
jgi:hypothetical protein